MSIFSFEFKSAALLPAATTLSDSDVLVLQTASGTKKITLSQLRTSSSSTSIPLDQKASANGVATLDSNAFIPDNQIPSSIARDSELTAGLATKSDLSHTHPAATTSVAGFLSSTDKTKLDGIASGATANSTDTFLLSRSNHTGTQEISTITNLQTSLDAKASKGANSDITSLSGLTTAISIAQGGTGATSASNARTALGAAASGSNSDITSLSGLTTALSIAQGGTGSTTAAGARSNLGAAASGVNSDITRLNGLTTALSIAQGGTGSNNASGARSNLGILASKFVTITGNYTILPADVGTVFDCSVSGGASTFTLPSASSNQGFICTIRKTDSSANLITVACAGSDTINGLTSIQLSQQFQALTLVSNGTTAWSVLSNQITGSNANQIQSIAVASSTPTTGQVLFYNGTQWAPRMGGKVLQAVYGSTSTQVASTTTSFVSTGLSATITPLFNTSKILVIYFVNGVFKFSANTSVNIELRRGGTTISSAAAAFTGSTADLGVGSSGNTVLDSPATTSATTYTVFFSNNNGTGTVYTQYFGTSTSTICLLEVSA